MVRCPHHGQQPLTGSNQFCSYSADTDKRSDRFGRMFDELPASFVPADVLIGIGDAYGKMRETGTATQSESKTVPVGHVFFGQFVDHDITLDVSSSLSSVVGEADSIPNSRTPQLDLDCIYGGGREASPYLYDTNGTGVKLLTGAGNRVELDDGTEQESALAAEDLQRNNNGVAMIGDFRNDENRVLSQLQLAMIRFHNQVAEEALVPIRDAQPGVADEDLELPHGLFEAIRQTTTWHYQWSVVFDFLHAMCGKPVVDDILANGRKWYCGGEPYIPVEFSVAAYRFGHSMVPISVQFQKNAPRFDLFGDVYGLGFKPLVDARGVVDWHEMFHTSQNRQVQKTLKLNTKMSPELLELPVVSDPDPAAKSLASRNLRRGNQFLLPAGERVAEHMGRDAAEIAKVMARVKTVSNGAIDGNGAPLWLYILAEAQEIGRARAGGQPQKNEGLGPVGARIVAEVIIGLLEMDEHSFLGSDRNWLPDPDRRSIGEILASTQSI